jgi:hypothetical protein
MKGIAIAAGALALTLVVSWPLARCFDTCLGASEDPILSVYFLRWLVHSLTTPGVPLLDATIFAPYRRTLALGEYIPTHAALAFPAIVTTGNPIVGHNVVVVLGYMLAALGTAALASHLTGATGPALLAGLIFAYSPRLLHQAHNLQTMSTMWFPWLFLALERFCERPTWTAAGVVAAVGLAIAGSSMIAFAFAAVAGLIFLAAAVSGGSRPFGRTHLVRLIGVGVPAAVLIAAYVAPYRALAREWRLGRTLAEVERHSVSVGDYLGVPPEHLLHRLLGVGHVVDLDHEALFPGIVVTALVVAGLVAVAGGPRGLRQRLFPYLVMACASGVLAFGPSLETPWGRLALPYRALYGIVPGFDAIRTPRRFAGFLALGVALLAATGAAWLIARLRPIRPRLVLAGLAVVILIESVCVPFPGAVRSLPATALPEVYRWLAEQDPRTVALELPMVGNQVKLMAAALHLRRTVNGWSSYMPPHYHALVRAMMSFPDDRTIALIQGLHPDVVIVDRRWLDPARAEALAGRNRQLWLARAFDDHLVFRVEAGAAPGLEELEATADVARPPGDQSWQGCVTVRNAGPRHVPLYPLRRLRLDVGEAAGGRPTSSTNWLPLDLAPGAGHTECVPLRSAPGVLRITGEIEGGGRVYRFVVVPTGAPQHPVLSREAYSSDEGGPG